MSYIKLFITVVIAMSLVLGVYEWYNMKRSKQYVSMAYISEGLSSGAAVKMNIEEYYFETGEFPSSNQELNLPAPEEFIGQSLTSL